MSVYLRNEKKFRGKIGNALWYPLMVLFAALAGGAAIIAFIMPRMAEVYSAFRVGEDQDAVLELARVYRSVWVSAAIFILLAASVIGSIILRKYSSRFAYLTDYMFLKMPLFGGYIKAFKRWIFPLQWKCLQERE